MTSEKDITNQSREQSWYWCWHHSNSWRVMAHLPTVLGSYGFLILHLLLRKTSTPCNTWINTYVFALHLFWILSAQNGVQVHQKPVFWGQQEPPGENRSGFGVSCVSGSYGYIHSNAASPSQSQKICAAPKLPGRVPTWTGLTCRESQWGSRLNQCSLKLKYIAVLTLSSSGRQFEYSSLLIDVLYKPTQMSFKGWTLKVAGGKYPHYVLRFPIF